jgi:hypothetical protein
MCILFSQNAFPCALTNPHRHTNPDGSTGGEVNKDANVHSTAFISYNAKVCDTAWVFENAKVLDEAVIKENAWVREFSIIKERAVVAGSAVVWGTQSLVTEVSGDSRIFGNARVLGGTRVFGRAQVFGSVTLEDSIVSEAAKVCEGHILIDQDISDDYFCNKDEVASRIEVTLESYKANEFNKKKDRLEFKSKFYNLSGDKSIYQMLINGQILDSSRYDVRGDTFWVDVSGFQSEGWNSFQLIGRDEYGKSFNTDEQQFFLGSITKNISIQNSQNVADPSMAFVVKYSMEGREFSGVAKYTLGVLSLYGLPYGSHTFKISLEGIGNTSLVSETFESMSSVPDNINSYVLPAFVNNNGAFSQGLDAWKISHPEHVQVISENGKAVVEISGDGVERVEISKAFNLSSSQSALSINFVIPELNKIFLADSTAKVKVILASLKRKVLLSREYDASFVSEKAKNLSLPSNGMDSNHIVFIRIEPGVALTDNYSKLRLRSANLTSVFVDWNPLHLNYLNDATTTMVSTSEIPEEECEDQKFSMDKPSIKFSLDRSFNYFSAGQLNDLGGHISENRIWGSLTVSKASHVVLHDIYLIGYQNDIEKFRTPLSTCARRKLSELQNSTYSVLSYNKSLVDFLFAVKFPIGLETAPGSKVSLTVAADVTISNKRILFFGNEIEPTVLVATPVPQSRWYSFIDSYDINIKDTLRTGGDKWVLPGYSNAITNLLASNSDWGVNDISKLNGGQFPGHDSHTDGRDADFKFDPFNGLEFKLNCLITDAKWKRALDKIEAFLVNSSSQFHLIETIFITREADFKVPAKDCEDVDRKFMEMRFENRCLANRFVNFDMPLLSGSLLKHQPQHYDHLHVRYNLPQPNGTPLSNPIQIPASSYDLDKLWFQIVDDELVITPKIPSEFTNMVVLWRFQDVEGFDSYDSNVEFGQFVGNTPQLKINNFKKPVSKSLRNPIKHIYVTFGNNYNGGCRIVHTSIDLSQAAKAIRWSYSKDRNGQYIVTSEGMKK